MKPQVTRQFAAIHQFSTRLPSNQLLILAILFTAIVLNRLRASQNVAIASKCLSIHERLPLLIINHRISSGYFDAFQVGLGKEITFRLEVSATIVSNSFILVKAFHSCPSIFKDQEVMAGKAVHKGRHGRHLTPLHFRLQCVRVFSMCDCVFMV